MAVDSQHRSQLNGIPYEQQLRYAASTQFNNPWVSGPPVSSPLYSSSQPSASALEAPPQLQQRPTSLTLPPYNTLPITTTALAPGPSLIATTYQAQTNLQPSQDLMHGRTYPQYQPPNSAGAYPPPSGPGFTLELPDARTGFGYAHDGPRRPSHPFDNTTQQQRDNFNEVVDASSRIISLSQSDITPTPRNMYGDQSNRSSPESYGFPPAHSPHSSISSASGIHSYGSSAGEYSLTDYSSASESVELNHRTLPRPSATVISNSVPPAAQSMMGQFSSKVSSTQKKHKCKVCDKRFTRPSSLQTHIYSHTGEKPFACDVEGCGRHFSVVSNLRRHRKVHKNKSENNETNDPLESQSAASPEEA